MSRSRGISTLTVIVFLSLAVGTVGARGESGRYELEAQTGMGGTAAMDIAGALRMSPKAVVPSTEPSTTGSTRNDDLGSWMRNALKDFRPRACKSSPRGIPSTSWPARGEAAISFCQ